jgi:alanine racemase
MTSVSKAQSDTSSLDSLADSSLDSGPDYAAATLTINLDALMANYRQLSETFTGRHVGAAVKANAYGTGQAWAAPALFKAGCRIYFVAVLAEAVELREILGPQPEIYVLAGVNAAEIPVFLDNDLRPALNHLGQIKDWSEAATSDNETRPAALHVDTGMARLGLPDYEFRTLLAEQDRLAGVDLKLVMTHLACADEPDNPANVEQRDLFKAIANHFPEAEASFANGAGILLGPEFHFDVARAGLALYGGNPFGTGPNPMSEVVHLKAKILQVREIDSPQAVGYGASHRATGPTRIATIPVGYADGYPRSLGNRGFAVIDGIRIPVVGRVSMDLITVDVTDVPEHFSVPGCEVNLLGGDVSANELAPAADTVDYELFTRLGRRFKRTYIGGV